MTRSEGRPNNLNAIAQKQIEANNVEAIRDAIVERMEGEGFHVRDLGVKVRRDGRYTVAFIAEEFP